MFYLPKELSKKKFYFLITVSSLVNYCAYTLTSKHQVGQAFCMDMIEECIACAILADEHSILESNYREDARRFVRYFVKNYVKKNMNTKVDEIVGTDLNELVVKTNTKRQDHVNRSVFRKSLIFKKFKDKT